MSLARSAFVRTRLGDQAAIRAFERPSDRRRRDPLRPS